MVRFEISSHITPVFYNLVFTLLFMYINEISVRTIFIQCYIQSLFWQVHIKSWSRPRDKAVIHIMSYK